MDNILDDNSPQKIPEPASALRATRKLDLIRDLEDSVALAIEGAFDRFASRGPRVLKVGQGHFAVRPAPRFEV